MADRERFRHVPGATYRLQFNGDFTLEHARGLLDYLQALGVTDVYASPLFQAGPNSSHGYDTCSHASIGDCLGGRGAFDQLAAALRERGMGLLLDVVPNHMGASPANPWWWDVLKHGRESRFAGFFDIDWERGNGKVVLPILGERLAEVIRAGHLKLEQREDWVIAYHDHVFPVAPGTAPKSPARLGPQRWIELLDAQHYRLAFWRVGPDEINYRRFFDVSSLVALRMEDPRVFEAAHETLFELIDAGAISGLRIDHPDGLRDPRAYFERLQRGRNAGAQLYVVGEKILSGPEALPLDWPVAGTTGYDFLVQLNALFVARANEAAMTGIYQEFCGTTETFEDVAYRSKKRILELSFAGDVEALARRLHAVATRSFAGRDLTLRELRAAMVELIACFAVYRTYVTDDARALEPADAEVIERATKAARHRAPQIIPAIEFLRSVLDLTAELPSDAGAAREFILKFQQLSGPAAAKGIEDTAFYNDFRLVSLNEVGGEPGEFGIEVEEFHQRSRRRAEHWPHSLLATATHDTKRGEDTRARINVLSEMPDRWRAAVLRWRSFNARHKVLAQSHAAPDALDEYLLYQTLVGTWTSEGATDVYRQRIAEYMLKAVREAKRHTSWTDTNAEYERGIATFVDAVLAPANAEFLGDFLEVQRTVAYFGVFNSLAQTLLKLTSPGVPDLYQGTELWDFSLVDPDNRRPVDFALRRELLEHVRSSDRPHLAADASRGAVKMFLIQRTLEFRNRARHLFAEGDYEPLEVTGDAANHLCAFARINDGAAAIVVVPRLLYTLLKGCEMPPLADIWNGTEIKLPGVTHTRWRNVLTGEDCSGEGQLPAAVALKSFPVALLAAAD